jgi:hypothetical protein
MVKWLKSRWGDLVILGIYLLSLAVLGLYIHSIEHRWTIRNCLSIENLKAAQVEKAKATIELDTNYIIQHPEGQNGFSRALEKDIIANRAVILRFPPVDCQTGSLIHLRKGVP